MSKKGKQLHINGRFAAKTSLPAAPVATTQKASQSITPGDVPSPSHITNIPGSFLSPSSLQQAARLQDLQAYCPDPLPQLPEDTETLTDYSQPLHPEEDEEIGEIGDIEDIDNPEEPEAPPIPLFPIFKNLAS